MNEQSWFQWVLGVAVALIAFIGTRLHKRVDENDQALKTKSSKSDLEAIVIRVESQIMAAHQRVDTLEKEKVSRAELTHALQTMREDRLRMHQENREDLDYIRRRLDDLNDRP
mgnify:CR=1 FL=1